MSDAAKTGRAGRREDPPGAAERTAGQTAGDPAGARLDRRAAIKWMLAAGGAALLPPRIGRAGPAGEGSQAEKENAGPGIAHSTTGYGTDPDLLRDYQPGDLWPLTFTPEQRRIAAALCALIIPADEHSPGAADLRVHDFIDEWISAPYPDHQDDQEKVLAGLAWIEEEARRRFGAGFADLEAAQQREICDEICYEPAAADDRREAASFFRKFRDLTAGGFYTTPEGMRDIGYVGNHPLISFDGPPPEVLARLGLEDQNPRAAGQAPSTS